MLAAAPEVSSQPTPNLCCPVCAASVYSAALAKVEGYTVHECDACGLRFSDPMRHPGSEWYRQSPHYQNMLRKSLPVPMWLLRREWKFATFFELGLRPGGRLLEVGCGSGDFLRLAREHGYQVTGIDLDDGAIAIARERYGISDTHVVSVDDLISDPGARRYDAICLFEVLEHLADPVGALRGLANLLTPGGYLVLSVPGSRRWPPLFYADMDYPPNHLTLWTPQAIEACLTAADLKNVTLRQSPLVGEQLWAPLLSRLPSQLQVGLFGVFLKIIAHFVVAPPAAKLLSLAPQAGGFRWMGVGRSDRVSANPSVGGASGIAAVPGMTADGSTYAEYREHGS